MPSRRSLTSGAKEPGLRDPVLRRRLDRVRRSRRRGAPSQATPMSADHGSEITRLRQENDRLRMERDIQEMSIAISAGPQT